MYNGGIEKRGSIMSAQPLTYERVLEMFEKSGREFDRRMEESRQEFDKRMAETDKRIAKIAESRTESAREFDKQMAETDRLIKVTNIKMGALDSRVGKMIEKLVGEGDLVDQFRELGFKVKTHSRHKVFGDWGTDESGEIDLFMEDGDVSILVEVKTTLKMDHVIDHIERMEKYRRFVDADGSNGKRYIGAVAGTVIAENVINFAHENGMYVIIQSARAVEILAQPEGFKAKEW